MIRRQPRTAQDRRERAEFAIDDWQIDMFLFSGFDKDVIPKRAIAAAGGDMRKIVRSAPLPKLAKPRSQKVPQIRMRNDVSRMLEGGAGMKE
jgi:hypothetical protein